MWTGPQKDSKTIVMCVCVFLRSMCFIFLPPRDVTIRSAYRGSLAASDRLHARRDTEYPLLATSFFLSVGLRLLLVLWTVWEKAAERATRGEREKRENRKFFKKRVSFSCCIKKTRMKTPAVLARVIGVALALSAAVGSRKGKLKDDSPLRARGEKREREREKDRRNGKRTLVFFPETESSDTEAASQIYSLIAGKWPKRILLTRLPLLL